MMNNGAFESEGMCERDRRNIHQFRIWFGMFAAAFLLAIVVLGPGPEGFTEIPLWMWALALSPIVLGIFMVRAYIRFLLAADEMLQRIHLEALATGCGTGIILSTSFGLLAQVLGSWEDSGAVTWAAILLAFSIRLSLSAKHYNA